MRAGSLDIGFGSASSRTSLQKRRGEVRRTMMGSVIGTFPGAVGRIKVRAMDYAETRKTVSGATRQSREEKETTVV